MRHSLRHSLLMRLLLLSLTVALGAVAATAVLATYSTGEQLQGELSKANQLVETDTQIYSTLLSYAGEHDSWAGVEDTVRELAAATGRRIALTDSSGRLLVDSARLLGHDSTPLPSLSAATIDWAAPSIQPQELVVKAGATKAGGVSVAKPGIWPYWRMDDSEKLRRARLARQAVACLERQGQKAYVVDGPEGVPQLVTDNMGAEHADPEEAVNGKVGALVQKPVAVGQHPCVPEELTAPSKLALTVNAKTVDLTKSCLDENGVDYAQFAVLGGLSTLAPKESHEVDAGDQVWVKCTAKAQAAALRPYVAEPANLYLGSSERFNAFAGDGLWRTGATALLVLLIAAAITILAGRRMMRPIHALTGAAQRMTAGDRTARVSFGGKDEVGRLAGAFNTLAETIARNEQQRKAMVSDIAHELRTPLANVRGYLEAAEDGVVPVDRALVRSLLEDAGLLEQLVGDLQQLALADAGMLRLHPEDCDVADLARQVVAAYVGSAERAGVRLSAASSDPVTVQADPGRLRQALGNLVDNAIAYTGSGGEVEVSVRRSGAYVECSVSDTGPGIAAEHLPHLFERFYRADPSRSRATGGSGLGLAITKHLVEAHHGMVEVKSTLGEGSVFTIRLPVSLS